MKLLNSLAFAFFLIFLTFEPCSTFTQTDYLITDLESSDSSGFANEANSWTYKYASCPSCIFSIPSSSECDPGQLVYGGPEAPSGTGQVNFGRSYSISGTPWKNFGVELELWAFATAELSDPASVNIFSTQIASSGNYYGSNYKLIGSCSTNFQSASGSQIKFIYKYLVRTGPSTPSPVNTIDFLMQKGGGSPAVFNSLGIRNVKIYNMGSLSALTSSANFPCWDSQFWNGVGGCGACQSTCSSCTGPSQGECTVCKTTAYDYGNGVCLGTACSGAYQLVPGTKNCSKTCSTGFYWEWTLSCVETCEEPLVQSLDPTGGAPICSHPCADATKFASPDGSCSSTCDPLLKSDTTLKLCLSPCEKISDFVYPDGSCVNTCPLPLSEKTQKDVKYCESHCTGAAKFLNPDGSCTSACDSYLTSIIEHGIFLCKNICGGPSKYLYPDNSCKTECPAPFPQKIVNGIQYCENPCFEKKTFLYEDGTCQKSCASPSIAKEYTSLGKTCKFPCGNVDYYNNRNGKCTKTCEYTSKAIDSPLPKICYSTLTEEEVEQVKNIADTADGANTATSTGTMIWSFLSPGDSTSAMMGPLAKMLQYIKFMDIMFPEKVLILMDAQSKDSGFATKMMKNVLKEFPSHELPRKFKIYQESSSFFVNLWPAIFNLSLILFVTGLVVFATAKTKERSPKIHGIFKNLMQILKWNVFLITFSGSVGDIVLFTALEFQTMQFDNFAAVFSFLLCLGINTLAILVVIQIIEVNSAIRRERKKKADEEEQKKIIEQQWNSYKALFECYKDYSFYQQIFLFVFLVRLAVFNAIIGYFYNYPLFQATTAVASNILMLGYLLIKKPMKKVVNLIQQIVLEFVLLPFNVCVLALAIMDYHEIEDEGRRRSIGDVMVYINLIAPILSGALLSAKAIVMGVDFYRTWKLAKANKLKKLGSIQTSLRGSKNFATDQTQILDITDQSMVLMENSSVRSNPLERNQRIRPLRSHFMPPSNLENDTDLISMSTNPNLNVPDCQNEIQSLTYHRSKQYSSEV